MAVRLLFLLVCALTIAGCSDVADAPEESQAPTVVQAATSTPVPEPTWTPQPPPTATAPPSPTPEPTQPLPPAATPGPPVTPPPGSGGQRIAAAGGQDPACLNGQREVPILREPAVLPVVFTGGLDDQRFGE